MIHVVMRMKSPRELVKTPPHLGAGRVRLNREKLIIVGAAVIARVMKYCAASRRLEAEGAALCHELRCAETGLLRLTEPFCKQNYIATDR